MEYSSWKYNQEKGYHYKKATFPEGGYQYLLYKPDKPGWVYWYNPKKSQVWCACPTKKNKDYGDKIRRRLPVLEGDEPRERHREHQVRATEQSEHEVTDERKG